MAYRIEHNISDLQALSWESDGDARAPDGGTKARAQFTLRNRPDHVVVRTGFESFHLVIQGVAVADDEHWQARIEAANLTADLDAVCLGCRKMQQDRVVIDHA